jgi:glycosyltransferase involved in cell wall biosynthesis
MPDSKVGWYSSACKKAISMSLKTKFDIIHSWACFFISNLVGLKIRKQTGLPWVVHFSDPWIDNPYHKYGRIDGFVSRKMEKTVIENADAIVFVTEETRQLVMRKYPSKMMDKAFVIPHCYDTELFARFERERNSKFTLTYTGSFYYGIRTPVMLFKALKRIIQKHPDIHEELNIQIVGELHRDYKSIIFELGINEIVSSIGSVPYLKSLEYILNADVLFLIDAPSEVPSVFLPSKLIEYIGSGNPILGITPLQGASASLIRKLNGIVIDPENVESIEIAILNLYERYKQGSLSDFSYPDGVVQQYDAMNTVKTLAKLFNEVCAKDRS